jgi:multidrug resistance efflux pump
MIRVANETQLPKTEKPKRPPRTKRLHPPKVGRMVMWMTIGVLAISFAVTLIPTTRWVEGDGYLTTALDAELRPSVEGVIDKWLVKTDDLVEQDQVLIQLNNTVQKADFDQASSELAAKRAELAQMLSQQELDRAQRKEQVQRAEENLKLAEAYAQRMHNGGFSPKEVEEADLKRDIATSQLAELRLPRDTVMAGQVNVLREQIEATARRAAACGAQLKMREIKAPLAGMVQLNRFEPGEVVKPEHVLGQVFDRSNWVVKLKLPEESIGRVKIDQPVQVALTAYPTLRYGYLTATIWRITPVVTPRTTGNGVYLVEAKLQLPKDLTIQPGMTATGYVEAGRVSWLYRFMGW